MEEEEKNTQWNLRRMPKIMQISIKSSENVFHDGRSIVINSGTGCANVAIVMPCTESISFT